MQDDVHGDKYALEKNNQQIIEELTYPKSFKFISEVFLVFIIRNGTPT